MTADPILDAEAYTAGEIEEYERIRAASVCADCNYCVRAFDEMFFSNTERHAICTRPGLDWAERAIRWSEPACEEFERSY
jgi:hypothetical protein